MAHCNDMKKGDVYVCKSCVQVAKACTCSSASGTACTVPLQCCGKEMVKK